VRYWWKHLRRPVVALIESHDATCLRDKHGVLVRRESGRADSCRDEGPVRTAIARQVNTGCRRRHDALQRPWHQTQDATAPQELQADREPVGEIRGEHDLLDTR